MCVEALSIMPKIIALWAAGVPEKNLNATPHLAAAVRGWAIAIGRSTSTSSPSPCDQWSVIPMGWQAAVLRSRGDAAWSAAIGDLQLEQGHPNRRPAWPSDFH